MDCSNHTAEVLHANVEPCCFSKHTVVELLLVLFCVVRGVSDALAVLLLSITAPHRIDWLFTGQEIVCVLEEHARVADIDSDLVIFALTMAVPQQSHLSSIWDDTLNFNSNLMFRTLLLPVAKSVIDHLVIEVFRHVGVAACPESEWLLCRLLTHFYISYCFGI